MYLRSGEKERRIKKEVGAYTGRPKGQFARHGKVLGVNAEGERGSFLEHQLQWLGDSVSSDLGNPTEEDGLERTGSCDWRLEFEYP